MAQTRPTSVSDAAQQLRVSEDIVQQMIAVGQIAVDSHTSTLLVLVQDDLKSKPRYTAVPPSLKQTFEAARVMISPAAPDNVADTALQVRSDIGFVPSLGLGRPYITPTELLNVANVPEITERIEAAVGKNRVTAYITAYSRRGTGPCPWFRPTG